MQRSTSMASPRSTSPSASAPSPSTSPGMDRGGTMKRKATKQKIVASVSALVGGKKGSDGPTFRFDPSLLDRHPRIMPCHVNLNQVSLQSQTAGSVLNLLNSCHLNLAQTHSPQLRFAQVSPTHLSSTQFNSSTQLNLCHHQLSSNSLTLSAQLRSAQLNATHLSSTQCNSSTQLNPLHLRSGQLHLTSFPLPPILPRIYEFSPQMSPRSHQAKSFVETASQIVTGVTQLVDQFNDREIAWSMSPTLHEVEHPLRKVGRND